MSCCSTVIRLVLLCVPFFATADAPQPNVQRPSTDGDAVNAAQAVVLQVELPPAPEPALAAPLSGAPNPTAKQLEVFLPICLFPCSILCLHIRISTGFCPFTFASFLCLVIRFCFFGRVVYLFTHLIHFSMPRFLTSFHTLSLYFIFRLPLVFGIFSFVQF